MRDYFQIKEVRDTCAILALLTHFLYQCGVNTNLQVQVNVIWRRCIHILKRLEGNISILVYHVTCRRKRLKYSVGND